jgi:hypothetical protein
MKNYPAIEEDIKLEYDDDDNMQIDADERKDYEWRVRVQLSNLQYQWGELFKKIDKLKDRITLFTKYLHMPDDPKCLEAKKELPPLQLQLKNTADLINALDRKIKLEFQPLPSKSKSRSKSKVKTKPVNVNPLPIVNINPPVPIRVHEDYEIPNGLLGVRRDLFNKLAAHRWAQDEDLQQRYGISRGDLYFKDHYLFKQQRAHRPKPPE